MLLGVISIFGLPNPTQRGNQLDPGGKNMFFYSKNHPGEWNEDDIGGSVDHCVP